MPAPTYRDLVLRDGAVAYWRLGEAAGATSVSDETLNGRTGTVVGAVTLGASGALGDRNGAATFASGGSVQVAHHATLDCTASWSIEAWFKWDGTPGGWDVIAAKDHWDATTGWALIVKPSFGLVFTRANAQEVLAPVEANRWHHAVAVLSSGSALLYVDGVLRGTTASFPVPTANTLGMLIGRRHQNDGTSVYDQFYGSLDEVAIYNVALSAQQVANHYNARWASLPPYADRVLADGPIGYWRLDDAVGAVSAVDASGLGRHATIGGGVAFGKAGALASGSPAAQFDGTGYGSIASALAVTNAHTLEAWAYCTDGGSAGYRTIFSMAVGYWLILRTTAGKFQFSVPLASQQNVPGNATLSLNTWYHLVATWDGVGTLSLYVNGALDRAVSVTGPLANVSTTRYIGDDTTATRKWAGFLDEVAVYNYALSAAQVAAHYALKNASLGGLCAGRETYASRVLRDGPVGYWRLGEASGNFADSSGYGRTGTVVAGAPSRAVSGAIADGDGGIATTESDVVSCGAVGGLGQRFTVECWLKKDLPVTGHDTVLSIDGAAWGHPNGGLLLFQDNGSTAVRWRLGASELGVWHEVGLDVGVAGTGNVQYLVLVVERPSIRAYRDGVLVSSNAWDHAIPWTGGRLALNSLTHTALSHPATVALLDEVAVYPYALSAQQIKEHYGLRLATVRGGLAVSGAATIKRGVKASGLGALVAAGAAVVTRGVRLVATGGLDLFGCGSPSTWRNRGSVPLARLVPSSSSRAFLSGVRTTTLILDSPRATLYHPPEES